MRRTFVTVVAALSFGSAANAQGKATSSVDINATGLRYADSVSSGGVSISPALALSRGRSSFEAGGTLSKFGSGTSGQGTLGLSTFLPSWQRLNMELAVVAGGSSHQDGYHTGQASGSARLHYARDLGGVWSGGGGGAMWDGASWRSVRELEAGGWITAGNAQLVVSATPTVVEDTIRYTDAQTAVTWKTRRADLGLTAGVRGGADRSRLPGQSKAWGSATVVAPISPQAALILAVGSYPLDLTQGFPSGRYVTAGVRFSTERRSGIESAFAHRSAVTRFDVRRISDSEIRIEVRAPGARSVDITGDLTHWEPQPLRAARNGAFAIVLQVTPGTSQVNIRVDNGPWIAPLGLTVVKDELGAEVGILVVPNR
jgi:hypothetical protein